MKKKTKTTRITTSLLAVLIMSLMIFSVGSCGMSNKVDESDDAKPTAVFNQETTAAPTEASVDGQNNEKAESEQTESEQTAQNNPIVPADQVEIDKALQEEQRKPTSTPEPVPTTMPVEELPTLKQLMERSITINTKENFCITLKFSSDVCYEQDGTTMDMGMSMDTEVLGYGGSTYTDTDVSMTYFGMTGEEKVLEYRIVDNEDGTIKTYSYNEEDNQWYVEDSLITEATSSTTIFDIDDIVLDDLTDIVVTADGNYYYATATTVAGSETADLGLSDSMGYGDVPTTATLNFKFDKQTWELENMDFLCTFNTDEMSTDEMKSLGIKEMKMGDLVMKFSKNTTPIVVPEDIIHNAIMKEEHTWETDDDTDAD